MRIAMIGQKGIPATSGGVERHVNDLAVSLSKEGHAVVVYARPWYTQSTPDTVDGVSMVYIGSLHTKHLDTITYTFLATLHAMRRRPDIIHYHGVGPALLSWIPKIFARKTTIVTTFHSIDRKHQKWGVFARMMLRLGEWATCQFADRVISVSPTIQQYARDVYDRETVYIPNAVPERHDTPSTEPLQKFGITSGSYLLMVSRLIPHKGAHYLVQAYQELEKTRPDLVKNIPLVITGDGYYTESYTKKLDTLINKNKHIIRTGAAAGETLSALYAHAKLVVHPSDNEGLPLVVLEAMSYGKPILVSNITEHAYLIPNHEFQFDQGSVSSLTHKLITLLEASKEVLDRAGQDNKKHMELEFTLERMVRRTAHLYEQAVNSKRKK